MFNCGLLILVQVNLNKLGTVQLDADTLSNDLGREHQIFQNGIVHRGEGSRTWSLLLQRVAGVTRWLRQDFTFTYEDNMLAREFLLQLTDQTNLDLLESPLLWHWDVDDNSL